MISDESDYSTSDTEDVTTVSSRSNLVGSQISLTSSDSSRLPGPRRRLRPVQVTNSDAELFVENIQKDHAYDFMARCVAYPISQSLFDQKLMVPRDNRIKVEDLRTIADKCGLRLQLKFPVPRRGRSMSIENYIVRSYVRRDAKDAGQYDGYDLDDMVVLWLHCQVSPGGPAYKLVKESEFGRRNGFKLSSLIAITKTYVEQLCKREHLPSESSEAILASVKDSIFSHMTLTKEPSRPLSTEYYYELLQRLLQVSAQRHKMIFNQSKLNSTEAQIVRLRNEVDDRDAAMLSNLRRSSVQYKDEEDAALALQEQQENLRNFKMNVNGSHGPLKHSPLNTRKPRTRSGAHVASSTCEPNVNEFKIKLSIWQVEAKSGLEKGTSEYFCSVKCSGSKNRKRSEYRTLNKDGKMEFNNEFNFKTRVPNPVLKIKLKELKDGLFFTYPQKVIATKTTKLNVRHKGNTGYKQQWKKEVMKREEEGGEGHIVIEYKYEVTYAPSIKMLGYLTVVGGGLWKEKRRNFFILYGNGEEEHGLQEIGKKGDPLKSITQLTEYDVNKWTQEQWQPSAEPREDKHVYGFSLLREGGEISLYAPSEEEKTRWVYEIFLLTKQTAQTDDRTTRSSSLWSPEPRIFDETDRVYSVISNKSPTEGRMWHTSDITALQGQHHKYFAEIINSMVDFNMETLRPVANGKLHDAHEALLQEYKHRYDISDGFYYVTLLHCLARKTEEGYFVDPDILQNILQKISGSVLRVDQDEIKNEALQRLFEYIKQSLRFTFLKFPYNLGENQLWGYSLLLQRLSQDLERREEVSDLAQVMIKVIELSMMHEYENHIAPSHLSDLGLEKYKYTELEVEVTLKVLTNLKTITHNCIMFLENFVTFYADSLPKHYKDIGDQEIRGLCESMLRLYSVDLKQLLSYLPTCSDVFQIFVILNNFCTNITHLQYGAFHKHSLHEAFLVHVLTNTEQQANMIIRELDPRFEEESFEEGYACKTVSELKQRLKTYKDDVDKLDWPNPDFRTVLTDMTEEKALHIVVKYATYIASLVDKHISVVNKNRYISEQSLQMFNALLALYPNVPSAGLEPQEPLDAIVLQTLNVLGSPLVRYLRKVLNEWTGPLLFTTISIQLMGVTNKLNRVREFLSYIDKMATGVSGNLHPDFSDTYLQETYRILLLEVLEWLETIKPNKRFYPAQVLVVRELVEKLKEIFNCSKLGSVGMTTRCCPDNTAMTNRCCPDNNTITQVDTFTEIDNILKAEEMQLLCQGVDHVQLLDDIRRVITGQRFEGIDCT